MNICARATSLIHLMLQIERDRHAPSEAKEFEELVECANKLNLGPFWSSIVSIVAGTAWFGVPLDLNRCSGVLCARCRHLAFTFVAYSGEGGGIVDGSMMTPIGPASPSQTPRSVCGVLGARYSLPAIVLM